LGIAKGEFMKIKISDKILSIPPYLSTDWSRIATIHIKGGVLAITVRDGDTINIPNLPPEIIDQIFACHAAYLEKDHPAQSQKVEMVKQMFIPLGDGPGGGFSINGMEAMPIPMQHNPAQSNAPNLPPEVLEKLSVISKIFNQEESKLLVQPVQNCNCFYCQILKAINPTETVEHPEITAEVISNDELQFQQWIITQTDDKLYSVTNKLDTNEKYNVYLGDPVGCTCGQEGCEHILAVLKS